MRQGSELRAKLRTIASRRGAVAFGVAPAAEAAKLPKIKIEWVINRWTESLVERMPNARSVIVYGYPSLDDADELEVNRGKGNMAYPGYMPLNTIATAMIRHLKSEGFSGIYLTNISHHKSAAVLAGLGSYGKNSLIISPKHGPWLRFGIVVTDAELPYDKPLNRDLCEDCDRCVRACPTGALTPYVIDPHKCLVAIGELEDPPSKYRASLAKHQLQLSPKTHVMCTQCQFACPYTPPERRKNVIRLRGTPPARKKGRSRETRS
jgi:epoxyqueuosine reductase